MGVSIVLPSSVVTSSPDSRDSLLPALGQFSGQARQIHRRRQNLKDSDAWGQKPEDVLLPEYDKTKQALEFRKLYKPVEIVMPALDPEYQGELERLNLTIRDVLAKHPNTPPALNSLASCARSCAITKDSLYEAFAAHKDLFAAMSFPFPETPWPSSKRRRTRSTS